jgi:signal transduction histidine kinase
MTDTALIAGAVAAAVTFMASIWIFPFFQAVVERHWLGISLLSQDLPVIYSRHATASTSLNALLDLLKNDVLPSLLIRQFLFLRVEGTSQEILLAIGVDESKMMREPGFVASINQGVQGTRTISSSRPAWIQLVLPLKVGNELLGYWIFGRRDPDDIYSPNEVPILQSLADQTAITLSNIIQTQQLQSVYQADINRFEQERLSLALELHDSILNELAGLMMKMDERDLPIAFQDGYQKLIQELRGIVRNLRPASLTYGLKSALEELADNLMERSGDSIQVTVRVESADERPGLEVEQHLFRILQEACNNALRHSQATEILISGSVNSQAVELTVQDNGTGFDLKDKADLDAFLMNSHFGLAGMIERAKLIGAAMEIESMPKNGTCVEVHWHLACNS